MKKTLVMTALLASTIAMAEEPKTAQPLPQNQPMMKLAVYDMSNKVAREVEKYSVKNKKNHLCWTAFNMPFEAQNKVVEIFTSPNKTKFSDGIGLVNTAKDGKTHTITANLPSQNNEFIQRCWQFDNKDPLGKYSVKVQINDIEFPVQTFEVAK